MPKKSVEDVELNGKRVLVRVDFNVPLDGETVIDDTRIRAALPTIQHLLDRGAAVVLMSHLGRPKGKRLREFSLRPVGARLADMMATEVKMALDCVGAEVEATASRLQSGEILLLENLRFHAEEEANDSDFARILAARGDLFVNDAFGTAHRAHASTEGITHHIATSVSGLLMQQEIAYLTDALERPERPFVAIMGGAKTADKVEVIEHLIDRVDLLLIGGGMQFTFFKAMGKEIGDSLLQAETIDVAEHLLNKAADRGVELALPTDAVAASEFAADARIRTVQVDCLTSGWQGLDIGPATRAWFADRIGQAKTVIWNGPVGAFEMQPFAAGTVAVAEAVAAVTDSGAISIIGGGDTVAAVHQAGCAGRMSHISTGGGASLDCMAGRELPGVAALDEVE